jgi:hypothetical protein
MTMPMLRQGRRSPAQVHRLADGLLHPLRHGQGIGLASHVLQQQHELVGTTRDESASRRQPRRRSAMSLSTRSPAPWPAVVDGGKAVQVHEQQGQAGQCQAGGATFVDPVGAVHRMTQPVLQQQRLATPVSGSASATWAS